MSNSAPNEKGIIFIKFELPEGAQLTPEIRDQVRKILGGITPAIDEIVQIQEISICGAIERKI